MSGASALRNAVKRKTHKERAQPSDRKRFGLLEKHKDYVERSHDYKKKQNYLNNLRKKAADKNPDEFYYKMHNSQVKEGKHVELHKELGLNQDTINLLKTQDFGYIVHKKAVDEKKIDKLKRNIHLIGVVQPRQHKILVESEEEVENFDAAKHFDTLPELLDRTHNRPKVSQVENDALFVNATAKTGSSLAILSKKTKKRRRNSANSPELQELVARSNRATMLNKAMSALEIQRNLAKKGSKKKMIVTQEVGPEKEEKEVVVYKWKRQRL